MLKGSSPKLNGRDSSNIPEVDTGTERLPPFQPSKFHSNLLIINDFVYNIRNGSIYDIDTVSTLKRIRRRLQNYSLTVADISAEILQQKRNEGLVVETNSNISQRSYASVTKTCPYHCNNVRVLSKGVRNLFLVILLSTMHIF